MWGPIGAVLLFATFGTGQAFRSSREFAAYLGLTPKPFSTGGKTVFVGISKQVANKRLRSVLIQGARAYIHKFKEAKTPKQRWLCALIERVGHGRATVALANKTVRTAWALLTRGEEYDSNYRAQSPHRRSAIQKVTEIQTFVILCQLLQREYHPFRTS